MSRRVAREELFKIAFESELTGCSIKEVFESYLQRDDTNVYPDEKDFIDKYSNGIFVNYDKICKKLEEHITGWSLDRIGNVEKTLLKISTYEILFEATPAEIVVNEVVELAKIYGDEKSHEFINGVIAKVIYDKNK